MADISKISPDDGSTILNIKDKNAVHYGDQSKGYVGKNKAVFDDNNGNQNSVVWNTNADKSITANGTSSSGLGITLNADIKIPAGDYIISNGVENNNNTFQFWVEARHNGTYFKTLGVTDTSHKSVPFTVDYDGYETVAIGLYFVKNTTYNQTIYPMIRDANIPDSTYEPWYMSNIELTDMLTPQKSAFTDIISGATVTDNTNYLVKIGNVVYAWIFLNSVTVAAWTKIAVIPSGYRPIHDMFFRDAQGNRQYKISIAGNLSCAEALSGNAFVICTSWITS